MKDLSPQTKDQSSQMLEHRFKSVLEHANPQTIIHFYRGTDQKHEFLRLLDDNRRREVIDGLDDDEAIAHFDTLKTPDQRKEFLGCFNHDEIAGLYISLDINMQKNLVTGLDFKQIKALHDASDLYRHRNQQKVLRYQEGIRYIIPFEVLKKLNDLKELGLFPDLYPEFTIRQHAEDFNQARDDRERKRFVRMLKAENIANLYRYFYMYDNVNKGEELIRAIPYKNTQIEVTRSLCEAAINDSTNDSELYRSEINKMLLKHFTTTTIMIGFDQLKTPDERRMYLKMHNDENIANLFQSYSSNIEKQKHICELLTQENFESFNKKLTPEESKLARSYLEEGPESAAHEDISRLVNELVDKRVNELVDKRVNELVDKRVNELVDKRVNELVDKRVNELVDKRVNELVDKRVNELRHQL